MVEEAPGWEAPSFDIEPRCCVELEGEAFEIRWREAEGWATVATVPRALPRGWDAEREVPVGGCPGEEADGGAAPAAD